MNRLILKYGYPIAIVILGILAWVTYRQFAMGGSGLKTFLTVALIVWVLGTFVFIYLWPRFTYSAYKRAVQHGLGGGPIPVNTLYAAPELSSPAAPNSSLLATGTDDVLYIGGWLDLSKGPLVLHVPDFSGRYYSVQFTDPSDGTNFAYVGTRTTGSQAGDYLVTGPGWQSALPGGLKQIPSRNNAVLVFGRVLVRNQNDVAAAYGLSKHVQLTPLSGWQPGE